MNIKSKDWGKSRRKGAARGTVTRAAHLVNHNSLPVCKLRNMAAGESGRGVAGAEQSLLNSTATILRVHRRGSPGRVSITSKGEMAAHDLPLHGQRSPA